MPNNDYINRSDALSALSRGSGCENICTNAIKRIPAADVEPVRHGRWIPHPGRHDFDLCSICGTGTRRRIYEDGGEIEYNYKACPWCRAKMDAELPKEEDNAE